MYAYDDRLAATSTDWAPWYVIQMDKRMAGRAMIADIITSTIEELTLEYPRLSATQKEELAQGKAMLEAETPSIPGRLPTTPSATSTWRTSSPTVSPPTAMVNARTATRAAASC